MKINEVEALVGITKKNIRFYEEQGLLSPRRNSENGYRDYDESDVEVLRRIKLLRKLDVPIQEIRQMQDGTHTVADGMRRHLVTLEREQENLKQAIRLCSILKEREERLDTLDTDAILSEMDELERFGTFFQNVQQGDVRVVYIAPIISSVVMVVMMLCILFLLGWLIATDPENTPPVAIIGWIMAVPVCVIGGVVLALYQRICEIGRKEIDDAKKY
ncbi:MAG: MerR family transcriptional regulator [Oscillospiraceae bacterium]|nr:MerR family transcriptional regulator [Oscillospiraceae bacterium]